MNLAIFLRFSLPNFTSKTQIFLFEKIGVMRGNSSTNLVNKEVSVQAQRTIGLSKLRHYFFSRES